MRGEDGQTLPELMIATVIGLIVVFAAFILLVQAVNQNGDTTKREDSNQRGRLAMEQITRELRAQVCLSQSQVINGKTTIVTQPAIVSGNDQSITFTNDLSGNTALPIERTIAYNQATQTLTESQYFGAGTSTSTTFPGFPNSPDKRVVLLTNVVPVGGITAPIFRFYPFNSPGTAGISTTPFTTPVYQDLSTSPPVQTASQTVDIRITFIVRAALPGTVAATNTAANRTGSTFDNNVYTRTADPTEPLVGTNCT